MHNSPPKYRPPAVYSASHGHSYMTLHGLTKRDLGIVFACSVVNLSTSYSVAIAFPIIPLYANTNHIDEIYAGSILGATSFAYLVASPIIGFALLRWNCKTLMTWGLLLIALGDMIFAIVPLPLVMLLARIVTGVGNAAAEVSTRIAACLLQGSVSLANIVQHVCTLCISGIRRQMFDLLGHFISLYIPTFEGLVWRARLLL